MIYVMIASALLRFAPAVSAVDSCMTLHGSQALNRSETRNFTTFPIAAWKNETIRAESCTLLATCCFTLAESRRPRGAETASVTWKAGCGYKNNECRDIVPRITTSVSKSQKKGIYYVGVRHVCAEEANCNILLKFNTDARPAMEFVDAK